MNIKRASGSDKPSTIKFMIKNNQWSCLLVFLLLITGVVGAKAQITISTTRDGDFYYSGEVVTFSIDTDLTNGSVRNYRIFKDRYNIVKSGSVTVDASGAATVTYTVPSPCFLQMDVDYNNNGFGNDDPAGAATCQPWDIIPENLPPSDLATFWDGKKAALDALPNNAVITFLAAESDATIDVYSYELNAGGGAIGTQAGVNAYGYFAKPKGAGPFPATMIFYGAGTYSIGTSDVKAWARKGAIAFNINPHPLLNGQPAAYYTNYRNNELNGYNVYGRTSRETSYYLGMFSRCYVAARHLMSLPEWDEQHLVMQGFSQGAGQAIATSYLVPETTALVAVCPALCDHAAPGYNRRAGWPGWVTFAGTAPSDPNMLTASRYYDGVNFTALMNPTVRGYFAAGFIDTTTVPGSVYAAYNNFQGRKEMLHLLNVGHVPSQPLYSNDSNAVIEEELGLNYQSANRQILVDYMENNPINSSRWKSSNSTLSSSSTAHEGLSSLKLVCPTGTDNEGILIKNMDLTYYAANSGSIEYRIRGDGANAVDWGAVKVGFVSASGGTLIQSTPTVIGQSPSWVLVSQPLSSFQIMNGGSPQWKDITSIRIFDGDSRAGSFSIDQMRIVEGNNAPVIQSVPVNSATANSPYNYTLQATDADGDVLTYSSVSIPAWLTFNSATRVLSGTPTASAVGSHPVILSVSDGTTQVPQSFSILVTAFPFLTYTGGTGNWETSGAWSSGIAWAGPFSVTPLLPSSTDNFTFGLSNVTLNSVQSINEYRIGDRQASPSGGGSLTISSGSVLNANIGTVGFNKEATLTISAGAQLNHSNKVNIGFRGTTTVNVHGTLMQPILSLQFSGTNPRAAASVINVHNGGLIDSDSQLNIGGDDGSTNYTGLSGTLNILAGGIVRTDGWDLRNGAKVVINPGGLLQIEGNRVTVANGYITSGYITSPAAISVIYDSGLNETLITTAIPLIGYDAWSSTNSVGAANDDDDQDGWKNLLEYAIAGNPDSGNDTKPTIVQTGNSLSYSFKRRNDDTSLTVILQGSPELTDATWTNLVPAEVLNSTEGEHDHVTLTVPIGEGHYFIRLKVSHP